MIANPEQASLDFGPQHEYRVRRSKRAKYLRINVRAQTGVEVVLPQFMSEHHVKPFVSQHQAWINDQIRKLGLDRPVSLPDHISLLMSNQRWSVRYEMGSHSKYRHKEQAQTLSIYGPENDLDACRSQLHQWLRAKARKMLPLRLNELSQSTRLDFNRVAIRSQKTRWGSCSAKGNINLNDRLILLSAELADYVMIHELCHTRQMNHSPAFWKQVERHCPDYKTCQRKLRRARQLLPDWI